MTTVLERHRGVDAALSDLWVAEFRGYFWGDGYLGITTNGTGKRIPSFTARAQITTRDDDAAMLHDIAERIGGKVSGDDWARGSEKRRPVAIWRTRNPATVGLVCDLLDGGLMPSKKRREVDVVRRFLALEPFPSGRHTEAFDYDAAVAARYALVEEIKAMHAYEEVEG